MAFNSSLFLLYFLPAFLVIYWLLPKHFRNLFLLLSGVVFYSWGAPGFLLILAASVILDYILLREMQRHAGRVRFLIFMHVVLLNLGLLLYYKYMNFFVGQVSEVGVWFGGWPIRWTEIIMPVGISFITFQKLSCAIDVYRKHFPGFKSLQDYALYLFMFPQMLAGPIVRPGQIADQIADRLATSSIDHKLTGFYRFAIGLAKKVLVADVLGVTVNEIFALDPDQLSTGLAWLGAITYSFQIYFDFSGYSDMAIGLALMIGFKLPENFNSPYLSGSITEFWRRWHITLSMWFRDYVFLPLAYSTSRKLPAERYFTIRADKVIYLIATSATFLLCGFWHGAAWTFIAWGAYHGVFLIIDRMFLLRFLKKRGKPVAIPLTFFILTLGWVLFRSESFSSAFQYLGKMFSFSAGMNDVCLFPKFWVILGIAVFFSFWTYPSRIQRWIDQTYDQPGRRSLILLSFIAIVFLILAEANIVATDFSPFIYFRF